MKLKTDAEANKFQTPFTIEIATAALGPGRPQSNVRQRPEPSSPAEVLRVKVRLWQRERGMIKWIFASLALGLTAAYLAFGALTGSPALRDASLLVMAICLTVLVGCLESAGSERQPKGTPAE